jgi:hypothetical protein
MRRSVLAVLLAAMVVTGARAQGVVAGPDSRYSQKNVFSFFSDYSNDSSHIILGREENRKIAAAGIGYTRRLKTGRHAVWSWEFDFLPLNFIRDPYVSGVTTVTILGLPGPPVTLPVGGPFSGPTLSNCASGTTNSIAISAEGVLYTDTTTQQCGSRWTYAGGISPMGQRVSFAMRRRVQPYLIANTGFLMAPHDEPVNNSARFNFTFEGGAGIEWFRDHGHSWTIDYRVHHLSNAYRGFYNPGIDNGIFRVGYRFGR